MYPVLYDWCRDKGLTIHDVLVRRGRLNFNRWLPPIIFENCLKIIDEAFSYNFGDGEDTITWKWNNSKIFTTKSVYDHLTAGCNVCEFKHIWKSKFLTRSKYLLGSLREVKF